MEFTQDDLKTGMVIEKRSGERGLVIRGIENNEDIIVYKDGFDNIDGWDNFKNTIGFGRRDEDDIIKVYSCDASYKLTPRHWNEADVVLWEEKLTEMTIKEIEGKLGIKNLKIIG